MLLGLLASLAMAQDLPRMDTQLFRPSLDAQRSLWTDDSHIGPDGYGSARAFAQYANGLWLDRQGSGEADRIVNDVLQTNLLGAYRFKGLRLGVDVPTYMLASSMYSNNTAGLGDIALDVKGGVLDREDAPIGLALAGRLILPTATLGVPLGGSATSWELEAIADRAVGDLLLMANLGTRGVPEQEVGDVIWTDQFFGRVGAGYALGQGGLSAELAGQGNYRLADNAAGVPLELMGGGWYRFTDSLVARGGLSTGLTRAIGSPVVRAVVGIGWEPPERPDRDLDGLVDRLDGCVDDAEDVDGYRDADGCPDPSVAVRVELAGSGPGEVRLAETVLRGPDGVEHVVRGAEAELDLHPGDWRMEVDAVGYEPYTLDLFLPLAEHRTLRAELEPELGSLQIFAVDVAGDLVADARVSVSGGEFQPLGTPLQISAGEHALVISAPGREAATRSLHIEPGGVHELGVVLAGEPAAPRARLSGDRIEITERVYFALNEARLLPASRPLLDDVAQVLREHSEIARLRVEGHTDSRGPARFNAELSADRAQAVRDYLIRQGVEPERLDARGYGSARPLSSDPEAEENRRVEFVITDTRS